MAESLLESRWFYRLVFCTFVIFVLFVQIMPVGIGPRGWVGPDLVLGLVMCWGLRRPDYLPAPLVAAVLLGADLLLQRPPGLWAGLVVLALELLRSRRQLWRDLPFAVEWALVSVIMAGVVLANALVLALFMVPQPAIGLYLLQLLVTCLAYPLVVALSAFVLGVRKVTPGQTDAKGRWL